MNGKSNSIDVNEVRNILDQLISRKIAEFSSNLIFPSLAYYTRSEKKKMERDIVKKLYSDGYDIYSIYKILKIPKSRVRKILCEVFLENEITLKYRPIPKLVEEFVIELYKRNYGTKQIFLAVKTLFSLRVAKMFKLIGLKTILMKSNVIEMPEELRNNIGEYIKLVNEKTYSELVKRFNIVDLIRLAYLTEEPWKRDVKDQLHVPEFIRSPVVRALVKLYNLGYSWHSIRYMLMKHLFEIILIINSLRYRRYDWIKTKRENYRFFLETMYGKSMKMSDEDRVQRVFLGRNLMRISFKLVLVGAGRKSLMKKLQSLLGTRNNVIYFPSKREAIRYVLERVLPAFETNGYEIKGRNKSSFTCWLRNNGFKTNEIIEIYKAWERIKSGEKIDRVIESITL